MAYLKSAVAALVIGVGCICAASNAEAARLDVTIPDVHPGQGAIRVALYDRADGFRQEQHALRVLTAPADRANVTVSFPDLPPGRYAVIAYHDGNDDGTLNLRFAMFPREPWGLSNDPNVIGPPHFDASAFRVTDPVSRIAVLLRY